MKKRISIIFTCFNRAVKTQKCIDCIERSYIRISDNYKIDVFVCNDGSTDNTGDVLRNSPLKITILKGNNYYWSKGMYVTMKAAAEGDYDYYLMINDDVEFYDEFIANMIAAYEMSGNNCGIVGSTKGDNGLISYGGKKFKGKEFISPDCGLKKCDLANWNCFLIDRVVMKNVGLLDPKYQHGYGDYDYCMKMHRKGFDIYIAPGFVGSCNRNPITGTFQDSSLRRYDRFKDMNSPKGMPMRSGIRYAVKNRDYLGRMYVFVYLGAYLKWTVFIMLGR